MLAQLRPPQKQFISSVMPGPARPEIGQFVAAYLSHVRVIGELPNRVNVSAVTHRLAVNLTTARAGVAFSISQS